LSVIEFLIKGGPVMIPIGLCSVVALATFLERLWALRRGAVVPRALCVEVIERVKQGRLDDARTLCKANNSSVSRVLDVALEAPGLPLERIQARVEDAGRREAAELERYTGILGTAAAIGPLLGLLGTVQGMIQTFAAIEQGAMGDMSRLAGGISVALITTFAGLAVGIPALVADRWVLAKVDDLVLDLEETSTAVVELLAERPRA
jgi:biopolymer transport protein ExbB